MVDWRHVEATVTGMTAVVVGSFVGSFLLVMVARAISDLSTIWLAKAGQQAAIDRAVSRMYAAEDLVEEMCRALEHASDALNLVIHTTEDTVALRAARAACDAVIAKAKRP